MHMADALLSPLVAGVMWTVSAGAIAYSSARLRREADDRKVPLMGVLGAFLFAAQMINFAIPGTGSSGHLGGGVLLSILLGPCAAFLTIASVLVVQALFFADGGLLALGCNIFNIGFLPAFVVFPLLYRKLIGDAPSRSRLTAVTLVCAVVALQLGPFAIVLQTCFSGISALPFATFALLMQPVHLAIGLVEGVVTLAVLSFVRTARPELLQGAARADTAAGRPVRGVLLAFLACAVITAGFLSWFASSDPDGLEWSIAGITGKAELQVPQQGVHGALAAAQDKSAWFTDYRFSRAGEAVTVPGSGLHKQESSVHLGTGLAGIVGTLLTLLLAFFVGFVLKRRNQGAC